MSNSKSRPPIAVVGLSAFFPGSTDASGFWRDILAGRDLITDVPPSHWLIEDHYDPDPRAPDKTYGKRGAFLEPVEFDPLEHGIPPSLVPATDTSQLLALILAKQVLEDATRSQFSRLDRDRVSVILGLTSAQELLVEAASRLQRPVWVKALREQGLPESEVQAICDRIADSYVPWQEGTFPGLLGNVVAGRIANRLNLGGTNCVTDAACASTFSALSMGLSELYLGDSDLLIVGGVETFNDIFMYMCFSKTPALSFSGDCRPFDAKADGTLLGEGLGFLALRRLADAERDSDRIYAVIRGLGTSSDGRAKSVYAPVPEGQAKALRRAYAAAGYSPATVELVEAHGTGTKAGDVAEFEGLRTVFEEADRERRQWCALGSVKSQIGHTKAAAGAAGLVKAVLAVHHKVLPPTIKVDQPNTALKLETSPFYINTTARPWIRDSAFPRRASVSSFGFGGSNFHVTLEEYRGPAPRAERTRACPTELVLLSAADPAGLAARCRAVQTDPPPLALLARDSQQRFDPGEPLRLAIVASDGEDLEQQLAQATKAISGAPESAFSTPSGIHYARGAEPGGLAFLFPGQGSQYLGMGAELAMSFEAAREVWDAAAELELGELPLHEIVFPRPVFSGAEREALRRRLTSTEWAQPAIGAASLAQLALLRALGVEPDCLGGHSFGEITALHAAGALDLASFLRTARKRGELMATAASEPGAMIAVSHPASELRGMLEEWGGAVVVANHNGPRQVVLSGAATAIDALAARLAESGITARRLPVSTAFHSPLVEAATVPFRAFLDEIELTGPDRPVYANAEAAPYPEAPDEIRAWLSQQIARPVRFAEQVEAMYRAGTRTFVEVGPGSVLTNLVTACLEGQPHLAVSLDRKGQSGVTALWSALGRLAVAGVRLRFEALWEGFALPKTPVENKGLTLRISGTNYAKPYPPAGGAAALPAPNPERPAEPARLAPPVAGPDPAQTAPTAPFTSDAWLAAYQEMQRQTAEAHAEYQRAMAESHSAFLKAAEASFAALASMAGGGSVQPGALALEAQSVPPPLAPRAPGMAVSATAEPMAASAGPPETPGQGAGRDARSVLLTVVSEKTGYPPEMLRMEMDLEADLGIDSIKRVEILAALQESLPALPQVPASEMTSLRTLGEIADRLSLQAGSAPSRGAEAPATTSTSAAQGQNLRGALLSVVAGKTGYPAEMLKLEMDLEADLGIDSIKRVEILAALQEIVPGLAQVPAAELAALRTLGEIAAHLDGKGKRLGQTSPEFAAPRATSDLGSLLLAVVAEKTGYPAEMLKPEMDLEADLGIDSIKRVEILAALQDVAPDLPQVPAAEMAALRTLAQVAERLGVDNGVAPQSAEAAHERASASTQPLRGVLGRFELASIPAPAVGLALGGLFTSPPLAITQDGAGVAAALAERLRQHGVDASVFERVPERAGGVVFLGGLRKLDEVEDAIGVNRRAFEAAQAVAPRLATEGGVFVTVQDTGGDFGLVGAEPVQAWLGGLAGLAKSAALEWPKASVRAIDLERGGRSPEQLATALADELLSGGLEVEVGLHADGTRTTLASRPRPCHPGPPLVDQGSVIVATGGGRGVTAAAVLALARSTRCKIAILGRTELADEPAGLEDAQDEVSLNRKLLTLAGAPGRTLGPTELRSEARRILAVREIRATLAALGDAGSESLYLGVDVRDEASVTEALTRVREAFGAITGVVHGAGVLADKLIEEKTRDQFDRVFDTKVLGLRSLLAATREDPLRVLVMFSSVAARCGNLGQSDYAMANEVLNKVAGAEARRRGRGCVVRAINWGPWEAGMVGPALKARFEERGIPLIPLEDGGRRLVDELRDGSGAVEVVVGGAPEHGLGGAPANREVVCDILVAAGSHPFLNSHRVHDTPVVPVVMVLEWFARAASACRPDLTLSTCRDLKVLRGIQLDRFHDGGQALRLSCREISNGSTALMALELRAADGTLHYTATAELTERSPEPALSSAVEHAPEGRLSSPWSIAEVYDDLLFHGPDFRVIRSIEGMAGDGSTAVLAGTREIGWTSGPWCIDAAALDGGLQLAILWGIRELGRPSLPTSVGAFISHRTSLVEGPIRCALKARAVGDYKTISDIVFTASDGTALAELRDVELHVLHTEDKAARAVDQTAESPR